MTSSLTEIKEDLDIFKESLHIFGWFLNKKYIVISRNAIFVTNESSIGLGS